MAKKKAEHIIENRIKEVLKEKDMRPNDLVIATGISNSYVSRVISGRIPNVTVKTALKISQALEVKVEEIFTLTNISK